MVDYMFGDGSAQRRHPISQPFWDTAAVEGKIGDAGTLHLLILIELQSEISDWDAAHENLAVE